MSKTNNILPCEHALNPQKVVLGEKICGVINPHPYFNTEYIL